MNARSIKMIATNDLIEKKLVNARIPDAEPRGPRSGGDFQIAEAQGSLDCCRSQGTPVTT